MKVFKIKILSGLRDLLSSWRHTQPARGPHSIQIVFNIIQLSFNIICISGCFRLFNVVINTIKLYLSFL